MSSTLGSISGNTEGGIYAYRVSKVNFIIFFKINNLFLEIFQSALNAATKSLSIDLYPNKILCVSLHPGWVRTEMGGLHAPLDVKTSTEKIVDTILKLNDSHNGGFYEYDGKKLEW